VERVEEGRPKVCDDYGVGLQEQMKGGACTKKISTIKEEEREVEKNHTLEGKRKKGAVTSCKEQGVDLKGKKVDQIHSLGRRKRRDAFIDISKLKSGEGGGRTSIQGRLKSAL